MNRWLIIFTLVFACVTTASAQPHYNFRHLNASLGLSDGVVKAIGQDKYGYIWIGTLGGLNRFDGYRVRTFANEPADSTSLPPFTVRSLYCDKKGNFWIGLNRGLCRYDYQTSRFIKVEGSKSFGVFEMMEDTRGSLILMTNLGPLRYNPSTGKIEELLKEGLRNGHLLEHANDIAADGDASLFATFFGIVRVDWNRNETSVIVPTAAEDRRIRKLVIDGKGNFWYTQGDDVTLYRRDKQGNTEAFTEFNSSPKGVPDGLVAKLMIDRKGELWVTTNVNGLAKFDEASHRFYFHRNNPANSTSLAINFTDIIFQDKKGNIWAGTEGYGVEYFHPDKNLFTTLDFPLELVNRMPNLWARAAAMDEKGQYWLAFGGGVLQFDPVTTNNHFFTNLYGKKKLLYTNSIRSILYKPDSIWIGTADGLNIYHPSNGKMDSLTEADSVGKGFFWRMIEDKSGTIWIGERDHIYYRLPGEKQIHSAGFHPVLKNYNGLGARSIHADRSGRIWFGMNGGGLIMYDPAKQTARRWMRGESKDEGPIDNLIAAIVEDRDGIIWMTTFSGLTSFDPKTEKFTWYTGEQGLPTLKLSGIQVDEKNRLWIASTKGLLMLDSGRRHVKIFDIMDGLPTLEFSDMDAYVDRNGRFLYPTMKGFVSFNPEHYTSSVDSLNVYLSSFRITDGKHASINSEEFDNLDLKWDENFFSFQLTAFNYSNPEQTWYAYKLEGFDKDWIYTKDRNINYTNVPGGDYVLRYKATSDPNNWNVKEKTLRIHIGTVFYKATWFWSVLGVLVVLLLYYLYRNRMLQQRRIFSLQTKAQALEKEKALVMYENLKQQLNPHFLFNSLTSLGSLIKVNPKLASQFLDGMSKIYRYILKSRDNELVSLGEEVKFVASYILLQKTRFETGFEVLIDIPEEEHYRKIAPVTLQNLVENAIKHNIIDEESPLVVKIYTEGDYLVTRNNLQKKNFVDSSNKQGLANLRSLYSYLSRRPIIIEEDNQYYSIKIPLI